MRFNVETIQLTTTAHDVRMPSDDSREVEAANAASTSPEYKGRYRKWIRNKFRHQSFAGNLRVEVSSRSAEINQTNFEIIRFKNQMTYFIFRLRPVYFVRTIKEA